MSYGQQEIFTRDTPNRLLPTRQTADNHPFHRWFNFVAGYSPEYVRRCFEQANIERGDTVLDPFVGCGTTSVEAKLHGVHSIGYDRHPFLIDICKAKLSFFIEPHELSRISDALMGVKPDDDIIDNISTSAKDYLTKLFPNESLTYLLSARSTAQQFSGRRKYVARMILSKALEKASHSQTDGIYKAPTSRKKPNSYINSVRSVCNMVHEDVRLVDKNRNFGKSVVYKQSSEEMDNISDYTSDIVITSPPYLNNFDFAEMTRMYLYFWGYANSWGDITDKIRKHLIVNTTTALKGHTDKMEMYRDEIPNHLRPRLDNYKSELEDKKKREGKSKRYYYLIYPYFAQMTRVMRSTYDKMKDNGQLFMVVANSALYGIHIHTEKILAEILSYVGFNDVSVEKLRSRGDRWELDKREGSDEGLGEYEISAVK